MKKIYYFKLRYKEKLKRIDGAVKMSVMFYFKPPKSWSKKKQHDHLGEPHTQKPDTDNLVKGIKDALAQVAYRDDAVVWHVDALKRWHETDVVIVELEGSDG